MKNYFLSKLCVLCLVLSLSFLGACGSTTDSGGGGDDTTEALAGLASCTAASGAAVICGTVYASDGTTPVVGATLSRVTSSASITVLRGLTSDGNGRLTANSSACTTDDTGAFACQDDGCTDGSTTNYQITSSQWGAELTFTGGCNQDETESIAAASTTAGSEQNTGIEWLVIPGSYDGIQLLLSELKGCTLTGDEAYPPFLTTSADCESKGLTVWDYATSLNELDLDNYQAIFVNCGSDYSDGDDVTAAVQNYVNDGGNMYFSDLSDNWLTADFPGLVTYPSDKNSTDSGTLSGATVVDTGLQTYLGSSTMDIEFDLGVWTAMESVIATWTTYIEADISSLASTLTGTRPITVGGPQEDGCIFYTSYHVEGASTGADQELALKYLIQNKMSNCE